MTIFQQRLNEISYHINNGNENLGFRMLVDVVLDTNQLSYFNDCIAIASLHEKNENNLIPFIEGITTVLTKLEKENFSFSSSQEVLASAKEITKQYGPNRFQLGPVSMDIKQGQLIGLVGENGNGKTTLLRMLANDLSYTTGNISYPFTEKNIDTYTLRTKLTYIPQRTPKWFGKVKDNLQLTATHYGIKPHENEALVLMLMIRFGLWKFRNHTWNELSSGYKMRFELARTFLRKPKLLLLDEPLANLDILSQQLILEDLKMLGKSLTNPLGIVLSSQQLYEVEKVSDEVIFLKNGKPSSFNSLKAVNENEINHLVIEIETNNSKEDLINALQNFVIKEIKYLGQNYYIEIENITCNDFLKQMVAHKIQVQYFRDISFSTRRFFNQ